MVGIDVPIFDGRRMGIVSMSSDGWKTSYKRCVVLETESREITSKLDLILKFHFTSLFLSNSNVYLSNVLIFN